MANKQRLTNHINKPYLLHCHWVLRHWVYYSMMNFVHFRVAMLRYFHLRYLGHDLLNFRRKLVYPVDEKVYHDNLSKTDGHKV